MSAARKPQPPAPAFLSVVQMAERFGTSRRRFYELIAAGKVPPPCYRLADRRPVYPAEVQAECLRVRETGVGFDGRVIIFNRRPERAGPPSPRRRAPQTAASASANEHEDLVAQLGMLGVETDAAKVRDALRACFPAGTGGTEPGVVVKALLRHIRSVKEAG